jgi:nuclear transport factor 2 (NTF2) superfamily protein
MSKLLLSICAGFFAVAAAQTPRAPEPASGVPVDVQALVASLNENWLKRDAKGYASHFSEDTDWENAFGWRIHGRDRLEEFLRTYLWSSTTPR